MATLPWCYCTAWRAVIGRCSLYGPAGLQLGYAQQELPRQLGPVEFKLWVIVGRRSVNPLFSLLLPAGNDGAVTIHNTREEGKRDFISLPVSHSLMMLNRPVIAQTLYFLHHGRFDHGAS